MMIPELTVYQNGVNQVSGDQLNTFVQTANNVDSLRTLIGITNMEISLQGFTTPSDGGEGMFYWNPTGTAPDDNGVNNVVPNGAILGCWTRVGSTGQSSVVNSIDSPGNTITFSSSTGAVDADINLSHPNTWLVQQTIPLSTNSTAITQSNGDASTKPATDLFVVNSQTGGYINLIRNSRCDVAQRGLSGTITAGSPVYTLDGFIISCTGANVTWAQGATVGTSSHSLMITGNTSTTDAFVRQRIESTVCGSADGKTLTFQAAVSNSTGSSLIPSLTVRHASAVDDWSTPVTDVNSIGLQSIPSGGIAVVSYTFVAAANSSNGLEITLDFGLSLGSNAKSVLTGQWDLRLTPGFTTGLNNAPPFPELRTIQAEFAFCQRYYQTIAGETSSDFIGSGYAFSSSQCTIVAGNYPVKMRASPTIAFGTVGNFTVNGNATSNTVTGLSVASGGASYGGLALTATAATLSAGGIYVLRTNSVSGQITLSSEL